MKCAFDGTLVKRVFFGLSYCGLQNIFNIFLFLDLNFDDLFFGVDFLFFAFVCDEDFNENGRCVGLGGRSQ